MKTRRISRWLVVVIFAVAMAWVESAVVFDLRTLVDRIQPHQADPLPVVGQLGSTELVREAATLIMLLMVGLLAGRNLRSRLGYAVIAFGVWDIFYYVFLNCICGWPQSLTDWDILFLLPLPWWGPVAAPVCIALLMIAWGTLATQYEDAAVPQIANWRPWILNFTGMLLALYVFMADSIHVVGGGAEAIRRVLPVSFNWPLFCIALGLMSVPVLTAARRIYLNRFAQNPDQTSAAWRVAP
jgi:hypothetical protein